MQAYLKKKKYSETLIKKAISELKKSANRSHMSLYDLNKETYSLLRYSVKERESLGEHKQDVNFIDWDNPEE